MAGFHGRSGNDMYSMHGLHGLPADYELALQQQQQHAYDFNADLDMFTNTQFFDFDMGEVPENQTPNTEEQPPQWKVNGPAQTSVDFISNSGTPAGDFHSVPNYFPNADLTAAHQHQHPHPAFQQSNLPSQHIPQMTFNNATQPQTIESPSSSSTPQREKRKADAVTDSGTNTGTTTPTQNLEEASRLAAEEDKRRRNTAASARFRVKKKQREQALEKNAKEMTDRVNYLEQRVNTLEMENKLLKDLITEKSGKDMSVSELTQKIAAASQEAASTAPDSKTSTADGRPRELKIEKADKR